jgi:hypothetical protein
MSCTLSQKATMQNYRGVKRSNSAARLSLQRVGLPESKHLMRYAAQPE